MARIKLSKSNYFSNLDTLTDIATKEKLAVVLKDNAYGHGIVPMAKLSHEHGIKKCIVRTVEEAKIIADYFDFILILSDKSKEMLPEKFHITLNDIKDLDIFPKGSRVHIKVDTGMHRNGVPMKDLERTLESALKKEMIISGVCSHSRSSDELSSESFWQLKNFEDVKAKTEKFCKKHSVEAPMFHFANSATLVRFKEDGLFDMARVGIASYGYGENPPALDSLDLKPVMSLWADKMSEREIKKGERVGYGGGYESDKDMIIGTYDIGYGDGFFRLRSGDEYITPKGHRVLGRVSMDSLSLNCNEAEVEIFRDVKDLAKIFDTITYDILVKLNENIEREIYE